MNISPVARAALGVGVLSFVLYLLTQAPGLHYTDVGELAAACATWGVAHPTGYPLFTLIGHVWTLAPWPSVVKGLNILVALFTAASAAVMVLVCKELLTITFKDLSAHATLWTSVAGAGMFAAGTVVWSQSTALEVYALNLLLFVLSVYASFRLQALGFRHSTSGFMHNASIAYTVLSGLLFGFMIANHLSSVFLLPGFALMWWMGVGKNVDRIKAARWLVLPALIGPSLYVLLPLRSAALPPINWGMVHRGWPEFLYHVKGTQFGVWMFSDAKAVKANFNIFTSLVSSDLLYIGWILLAIGLWLCIKNNRAIGIGLLVIAAGNLGISLGYAIPDIDAYFLPTITVLTLLATLGIGRIATKLKGDAVVALVALPIVSVGIHFTAMDHSKHTAVESYSRWTLANAEENAVIITRQWDYLASALWYLQTVEGLRTDVAIIDKELLRRTWYAPYLTQRYPDVMKGAQISVDAYQPWLTSFERDFDTFMADRSNAQTIQAKFVAMLNALVTENPNRPIYVTPEIMNEEQGFAVGYTFIPVGPLVRLTRDTSLQIYTKATHLENVTQSLKGRTTRLDSALTQTVLTSLYSNAMYALEKRSDTVAFRNLRRHTLALDPRSRVSRYLVQRLP